MRRQSTNAKVQKGLRTIREAVLTNLLIFWAWRRHTKVDAKPAL